MDYRELMLRDTATVFTRQERAEMRRMLYENGYDGVLRLVSETLREDRGLGDRFSVVGNRVADAIDALRKTL